MPPDRVYPKGHAYAQMIGGDDEQLTTITLDDACYFMRKYYVPERAVVIVAGGVKVDDAVKSIQTWFNNVDRTVLRQAAAVSPMQVKDLLGRELDPTAEAVVILGDRASVTKAFADAGITDVKLVEPDYR